MVGMGSGRYAGLTTRANDVPSIDARGGLMIRFERTGMIGWALVIGLGCGSVRAQELPSKPRTEATWPGLTRAGTVLLPNGWSLKPAGRQAKLGDFPVAIAEHPTEPILAVLHAGYGEHEVVTLEAASGKVIARVALKESFQGLIWSSDGKRLFVGGGWDDVIYRFDHSAGLLSNKFEIKYPAKPGAPARPCWAGRGEGRRDALGRQRLRPYPGEVRRRRQPPARTRPRGRLLPLRPRLGRSRRPALRQPLGQGRGRRRRLDQGRGRRPTGPRRSTPTRCS